MKRFVILSIILFIEIILKNIKLSIINRISSNKKIIIEYITIMLLPPLKKRYN